MAFVVGPINVLTTQTLQLPAGSTTDRPSDPQNGMLRYNTTFQNIEYYIAGSWTNLSPLGSAANPAATAEAIYNANPSSAEGWYYYKDGSTTYGAYTRFNWIQGRHYLLTLKVINRSDLPSGSSFWTDNVLQNSTDTNISTGSWAKYESWNRYPGKYILLDMNGTIPSVMFFNTARTMYTIMQNNSGGGFGGLGCDTAFPPITTNMTYNNGGFYASGGPFGLQTGQEPVIQLYGINSFANNASNGNPDNAGLSSVARAGARVGCALDEGGHSFNNGNNGGSDSGFGFGFCAGNAARTGSCGYAEWNSSAVVNTLPGRLWVST